MKKILFHFQQVGGANALLPLIDVLYSDYNITITARDLVYFYLLNRGISVVKLKKQINTDKLLSKYSPDIVITDTIDLSRTSESIICKKIWKSSQKKCIPCIAYVDCWWAYRERFYLPGETYVYLPEVIGVIDSIACKEMIKCNFDKKHIEVLGSPIYEKLTLQKNSQKEKKNELGFSEDDFIIVFVSQPMEKYFGPESEWGFSEKTVLKDLIFTISTISEKIKKNLKIVVLLHPEDDELELSTIIKSANSNLIITLCNSKRSLDYIIAGDLITGMFSILLSEAVILKRLVIPIQLNLKKQDMLITNKVGATIPVRNKEEFLTHFIKAIKKKDYKQRLLSQQNNFVIVKNSTYRWVKIIRKLTMQ